jgi:hypothetical protein
VPFLPFVLLLAWQAISRSASFALGWATALYFGQVPGLQGRVLSVVSLVAAGWVIVVAGFALPLLVGAAAESIGLVERNFTVEPIHVLGLAAAVVLVPPGIAAATTWAGLREVRSWDAWLRFLPRSYPATGSLGLAVLEMVVSTPLVAVQRIRHKRVLLQVPLVLRRGIGREELIEAIRRALRRIGGEEPQIEESRGPKSWPLRTVGYAARHLLGAVVRGDPLRMLAGDLELHTYASNVAIMGPEEDAFRARAAIEREVALAQAYLTWSDDAQGIEDDLIEIRSAVDPDDVPARLDRVQDRMDRASLSADEWNLLYRLRLQVEVGAGNGRMGPDDGTAQRPKTISRPPRSSAAATKNAKARAQNAPRRRGGSG